MPRATPEWIARTTDTPIPPRVRLRVFVRFHGRCDCGCGRKIHAGEAWDCDHVVALCNGGENRERNLHPLLLAHHLTKSAVDVAEKSHIAARKAKHLGLRRSSKPLPCGRLSGTSKTMLRGVVPRRTQAEKHRETMAARKIGDGL